MALNGDLLDNPKLLQAIKLYPDLDIDVVGDWTLFKERVVRYYMEVFQRILGNVRSKFDSSQQLITRCWIDACCSSGIHIDKVSNEYKPGSALLAAAVQPPFDEYYFVDTCEKSLSFLKALLGPSDKYNYIQSDCNEYIPRLAVDRLPWSSYARALVFIDPYGLDINWSTIHALGQAGKDKGGKGTVDCFINYPQHDIQRNVCVANKESLQPNHASRMTAFWGDETWMSEIFQPQENLFGECDDCRVHNSKLRLKKAFKERLKTKAGFKHVLDPLPLQNKNGMDLFYLFFATNNDSAIRASRDCYKRMRNQC